VQFGPWGFSTQDKTARTLIELEVEVAGKLPVTCAAGAAATAGHAANGTECRGGVRPCRAWAGKRDLIPYVEAVRFENERPAFAAQREAAPQPCIQVLRAWIPQAIRSGARRVTDQIFSLATALRVAARAGNATRSRGIVYRRDKRSGVDILDRMATSADTDIACGESMRPAAVASILASSGAQPSGIQVRHGLTLPSTTAAPIDGNRRPGQIVIDLGELPSARQPAHRAIVAAKLVFAEGQIIHAEDIDGLRNRNNRPRPVDAILRESGPAGGA
jgi:hypothetical protein